MRAFVVSVPIELPDRFEGTATQVAEAVERILLARFPDCALARRHKAALQVDGITCAEGPPPAPPADDAPYNARCPACRQGVPVQYGRFLPHSLLGVPCGGGGTMVS
jgi:hypothetical protein